MMQQNVGATFFLLSNRLTHCYTYLTVLVLPHLSKAGRFNDPT